MLLGYKIYSWCRGPQSVIQCGQIGSVSHSQMVRNPDTGKSTNMQGSNTVNAGEGLQPEPTAERKYK